MHSRTRHSVFRMIPRSPRRVWAPLALLPGLSLLVALVLLAITHLHPLALPPLPTQAADPDFASLPLSFVPNAGQAHPDVRFQVRGMGGTLFFTPDEVVLALPLPDPAADASAPDAGPDPVSAELAPPRSAVVRLQFDGANVAPAIHASERLPGTVNSFTGSDPDQWQTNLPTYAGVVYTNLYDGIDLAYDGAQGRLKGTYTVAPGADPDHIRWRYTGAEAVHIDPASGDLHIALANDQAQLTEAAPIAHQEIAGQHIPVAIRYLVAEDGSIGFALGTYDPTHPLIIDPTLDYSTYLGGSNFDTAQDIALDSAGNVYVTGYTTSSNFPTANAYQGTYGGGTHDVFITKMSSDGSSLLFATYLGGGSDDYGQDIALDSAGNAYITGYTDSSDFPMANAYQGTYGGGTYDAFLAKVSSDGSVLLFSTYLGGSSSDYSYRIALDSAGNTYVIGRTESANFPIVNAYQETYGGGTYDAIIAKMSSDGSSLLFSTYLGGSSYDFGSGITVDSAGNAYVTGYTRSSNFPTANAYQTTLNGPQDAFIAKLSSDGSSLLFSTYLGGGGSTNDYGRNIALDRADNAYITGETFSNDFPTANAYQATLNGSQDAFIAKLSSDGSTLLFATYLGGSDHEEIRSVAFDSADNAYIMGHTSSSDLPTANAYQAIYGGGIQDAFLATLSGDGSSLLFSTYLGGSSADYGFGIALDSTGNIYVAGNTYSSDFPTANAYQGTFGGGTSDAFIARLSNVLATVQFTPTQPLEWSERGEGASTIPITVTRTGNLSSTSTVSYSTSDGTATAGSDYTPISGTLTFTAGQSIGNISIDILDDAFVEGTETFSLTLFNPTGAALGTPDSIEFSILDDEVPPNTPPIANNDSYSASEDTQLSVPAGGGVLANDSDADLDLLTATLEISPTHGSVALAADGSFTYDPTPNFFGTDSFTYRASDGIDSSGPATVTISVLPVNDAPIANSETYTTTEDTPLTVSPPGVLANDTDVEGDPLIAVLENSPTHGSMAFAADGSFTYTPDLNFFGTDSFTYRVFDGIDSSDPATATISVLPVNDAPIANSETYTTTEDTPLTVSPPGVLANDTDVEGDPLTAVPVSPPSNGSLAPAPDGSFTYTPDPDFTGADSFTYRASDGIDASEPATVIISVLPVNDPPIANNDSYAATEDTPLTVSAPGVLANDTDVEGDPLTAVPVSPPSNGSLAPAPDGSFTYTPDPNFFGTDSFTYRASDGLVNSNVATVTISVISQNDAPIANNDNYSAPEDSQLSVPASSGVLANDADVEGDPLIATLEISPTHGSVALAADGSFTYTPNPDFTGTDSFTYRASDGQANSNVATVTISVASANEPPTVEPGRTQIGVCESDRTAAIAITLSHPTTRTVSVDYATHNGTARATEDYRASTDTLTFPPGSTTQSVTLTVVSDTRIESDEFFWLELTNPQHAQLSKSDMARIAIIDAPCDRPTLQFDRDYYLVSEDAGSVAISLTLSRSISEPIGFSYSLQGESARATTHYQLTRSLLPGSGLATLPDAAPQLPPGSTSTTITIPIIDNAEIDGPRTLRVTLDSITGTARLGAPAEVLVTIIDDETNAAGVLHFSDARYRISENQTSALVTVERSSGATGTVTVPYYTADATATAGDDYVARNGVLTFTAGVTRQTFAVELKPDTQPEPDEQIALYLGQPTEGAKLGRQQVAYLQVIDDDQASGAASIVTFSQPAYRANENDTYAPITLYRTGETASAVTVRFATFANSATAGADYTNVITTVTFAANQTSRTVNIPILPDTLAEGSETVTLVLSDIDDAVVPGKAQQAILTLIDDEPDTVQFYDAAYRIQERSTLVPITVYRTNPTDTATVEYTTFDGTATAGDDYEPMSGTLIFTPGILSQSFWVRILPDEAEEGDETIRLDLRNANGSTLGARSTVLLTIEDDDLPPGGFVHFSAEEYFAYEGDEAATIVVKRTGNSTEEITVFYETSDGTATAGSDYTAISGTLTFELGDTEQTFSVPLGADDAAFEGDEVINLRLDRATNGAWLEEPFHAVLTIRDNEPGAVLQFSQANFLAHEHDQQARAIVRRIGSHTGSISVRYTTFDGTANANVDYRPTSGTLTFNGGETEREIVVPLLPDTRFELDETIQIMLTNPSPGVGLGNHPNALLTIRDDDQPTVSFSAPAYQVDEDDGRTVVTATLNAKADYTVSATYTVEAGTANPGEDYTFDEGIFHFAPGTTSAALPITIINDSVIELDETFTPQFTGSRQALLSAADRTTVTIRDDDQPGTIDVAVATPRLTANGRSTTIVTARVQSRAGLPVPNATVGFGTTAGTVAPRVAVTDADGVARTTLTATSFPATARVTARAGDIESSVDVRFDWQPLWMPLLTTTVNDTIPVLLTLGPEPPVTLARTPTAPVTITTQVFEPTSGIFLPQVRLSLSTSNGAFANRQPTIQVFTDRSGTATASLFPGNEPGPVIVTATIEGNFVGSGTVMVIVAGDPDGITLAADQLRLPISADISLTATVTDSLNQPVPQQPVAFTLQGPAVQRVEDRTTARGQAQAAFTCPDAPANVTVEARTGQLTDQVTVVCGAPETIDLQAQPPELVAEADAQNTIRVLVRDGSGQPVPGQMVRFTTTLGRVTPRQAVTDGQGYAQTMLTNPTFQAGVAQITAQVDGVSQTHTVPIAPVPYQPNANNQTPGQAARLSTLSRAYRVTQATGAGDHDYYRLDLQETATLTVAVRDMSAAADYDLHILQANRLAVLGAGRQQGPEDEQLTLTVSPGTYYVQVDRQAPGAEAADMPYTLTIATTSQQP